jgi:hypothetical protein
MYRYLVYTKTKLIQIFSHSHAALPTVRWMVEQAASGLSPAEVDPISLLLREMRQMLFLNLVLEAMLLDVVET